MERRIPFLQEVLTENVDGGCFFVVLGKVALGLVVITLWFYCNLAYYWIPFLPVIPIFSCMLSLLQFRALTPAPFQLVSTDKQISYSQT